MDIIQQPSPNHDSRGGVSVSMLLLHYTGMQNGQVALERLCDAEAKVSAHYLVEEDGRIIQMVDEADRAWHAGVASWCGHENINARSVGIEIVNPGHEFGYRSFPDAQMVSVAALSKDVLLRHAIAPCGVVGHSDVAFRRKQDPGELFGWEGLAKCEVGLWHDNPLPKSGYRSLKVGDVGESVRQLHVNLECFGYGIESDGMFGVVTELCVIAFQRHFRQGRVNGVWDGECDAILENLLKKR